MPTLKVTSKRNQRDFPWPGALLSDRSEPTWAEIEGALGEPAWSAGATLYVTGGEPTLRADCVALLAQLAAIVPEREIVLVTNGRLFFYARTCNALDALPANVSVEVCLLSTRREVHDRVVGVPESFDQASRGIQQVMARGRRTRVRVLVGSHNADHLHEIAPRIADRFAGADGAVWDVATLADAAGSLRVRPDQVAGQLESAVHLLRARELGSTVIGMPACSLAESHRGDVDRAVIGTFRDDCVPCRLRAECPGLFGTFATDPLVRVYPVGQASDQDGGARYAGYLEALLAHYVPSPARDVRLVLDAMCGWNFSNLAVLRRFFPATTEIYATDIDLRAHLTSPSGTVAFRADLREPLPSDRRYDFIALFKPPGNTPEMSLEQVLTHLLATLAAGGYVLAVLAEHTDVDPVLAVFRRRGMRVLRSEANALRDTIEPDHKWVVLCRSPEH